MSFGDWLEEEFYSKVSRNYKFEGCTHSDIEFLMRDQGVVCIPRIYQEILLAIGRSGLDFILGGEGGYKDLIGLKQDFAADLEADSISYPQDMFVFYVHHGYIFNFFRTKDCLDDPPVYGYTEASSNFAKLSDHISDFFRLKLDVIKKVKIDFNLKYSLVFNAETDEIEESNKKL